jgi:hypothetical protein
MFLEIPDETLDEIGTGRVGRNPRPPRRTSRQDSRSVSPVSIRRKRGAPYMSPVISPLPTGQPQIGGGDYDDDRSMYGDAMNNHGFSSKGVKRRGVRSSHYHYIVGRKETNILIREPYHLEDVTAVTGQKLQSGEKDLMGLARSATRADFTTPN